MPTTGNWMCVFVALLWTSAARGQCRQGQGRESGIVDTLLTLPLLCPAPALSCLACAEARSAGRPLGSVDKIKGCRSSLGS